jgi:type II secretory pathway pseudopilin PulG
LSGADTVFGENSNLSIMVVHFKQAKQRIATHAFTLVEILMAFGFLAVVMSGLLYGYVQANRMAEWSSMSLAAQSYASQGAEQMRAADWRPRDPATNRGPNTAWEIWPLPFTTNYFGTNYILDVPIKGDPSASDFAFFVTNRITVTYLRTNPPLLEIRSDAIWTFPVTRQLYTNTVILQRAPDQ